jgi:cell division GTPase FtsZ
MADPEANVIFGTCKDPRLDDEVKITLIAAAFPMPEESLHEREQELKRLLRDALPNENDLDTPSFLRKDQRRLFG